MKKSLTIVVLIGLLLPLTAQEKSVSFGIKAGVNFSTFTDLDDGKIATGLVAGPYANIRFSDYFAFQPELLYSMQGTKFEGNILGVGYSESFNPTYLILPLMVKYYFYEGLNVELGPQIGIVVDDDDFGDDFNTFDFGINAGLGYELENIGVNFGARYHFGLMEVVDDSDSKSSVIQFFVGYSF